MRTRSAHPGLRIWGLAAFAALMTGHAGWAGRLEVALVSRAATPIPASASIEVVLHGAGGEGAPVKRQAALRQFPLRIDLADGNWTVDVQAQGFWAAPRTAHLTGTGPHRAELFLYDAAIVRGRVQVEKGDPLPAELSLKLFQPVERPGPLHPRPRRSASEAPALRCPITPGGSFECAGPAGVWDVRARAPEHVSVYLWDRSLTRGSPVGLGTLVLRRGASVVGWVRIEGPIRQSGGCRLVLKPLQAASPQREDTERALSTTAQADPRGFFHLTGVAPGAYALTATLSGFAPAKFFPVRVLENRETQVQEVLVLHPPMILDVRINPGADLQQKPWRVQVFNLGETPGTMEPAGQGEAKLDGSWHLPGLGAGRFLVQVSDGAGSSWASQEVDLSAGSSAVDFELDPIEVRGTVRLGGEPVAGTLYFGGKMGVPSFRFTSDEKGRFEGYIAKEGRRWRVDVEGKAPRVERALPGVEVKRPKGKSVARLVIELPDGRLKGRVTDENEQPAEAMVTVDTPGAPPTNLRTASDGEFEARGFATGRVAVQARARGEESEAVWVQVAETSMLAPVHLVLKKKRSVGGWVLGPFGGVPGAQVQATAPGQIRSQAVTDAAGRFTLSVPASAPFLDVEILPPGYCLQARRVQLGKDDLRFYVAAEGGTLGLAGRALDAESGVMIAQNGIPLGYGTLRSWAGANGERPRDPERFVIPQVEAGRYEVCRVPFSQVEAYLKGSRAAAKCASGIVAPGSELTLALPGG